MVTLLPQGLRIQSWTTLASEFGWKRDPFPPCQRPRFRLIKPCANKINLDCLLMEVAGANRRWRLQFRYRGSRRESAVAQLSTLGHITLYEKYIRNRCTRRWCFTNHIGSHVIVCHQIVWSEFGGCGCQRAKIVVTIRLYA